MPFPGRRLARARCIAHVAVCLALTGCAARRVSFPTDAGSPFPDFAAVHAELSRACSGVRTLTAELALSGRAASQRLRGRIVAGFQRPASMRLEGVAPFGPPAFILAANPTEATLLLPRDNAVLLGAQADQILAALTGVDLAPADLLAILTGCIVPAPVPTGGRLHPGDWASVELRGGAVMFLRRESRGWQVRGARRQGWEIEYDDWSGAFPQSVRLRAVDAQGAVDLVARLSQLETNTDLTAEAFMVAVPPGADRITLDDLRRAGPLEDATASR